MNSKPHLAIGWILPGSVIHDEEKREDVIVGRTYILCGGEEVAGECINPREYHTDIWVRYISAKHLELNEYINPPEYHSDIWLEFRENLGLDIYPYEYFPRFRIVKNVVNQTYEVWGDEKILDNTDWQKLIIDKYFLPEDRTRFFTDGLHYFSANPDSELVWDEVASELKLIIKSYDDMRETFISASPAKGIFWMIEGKLVYKRIPCDDNGKPLEPLLGDAVSKSGSTYNHALYWRTLSKEVTGGKDYQYYPRGRVEIVHGKAKIYLNPNILCDDVKEQIVTVFNLIGIPVQMIADGSKHYECCLDHKR